jgi:2-amino-4-hydroxy-6-hydroxymethyldihydropteridine diphosphokinase
MILVALGSNQSGPWGNPEQTVKRALAELNTGPVKMKRASTLIQTAPFGVLNQPNFVNAVALIETALSPHTLLRRLHMIERQAGRKRGRRWGPRTLDLDLLDYHGLQMKQKGQVQKTLVLPHPGIAERFFVLEPIAEIAPRWKHSVNHKTAASMIQKL